MVGLHTDGALLLRWIFVQNPGNPEKAPACDTERARLAKLYGFADDDDDDGGDGVCAAQKFQSIR